MDKPTPMQLWAAEVVQKHFTKDKVDELAKQVIAGSPSKPFQGLKARK